MSKVSAADTGYPGAPITGVVPTTPSTTGCPGRTATPCTASVPTWATTDAVWSPRPALDPAMITTRSARSAASCTAAAIRSGSSGSIGSDSTSQPCSPAWPASISELVSAISPTPGSVTQRSDLVACGQHRDYRSAANQHLSDARRGDRGDIDRTQPVSLRQQQLTGRDILTDGTNMLVGHHRGDQLSTLDGRSSSLDRRGGRARASPPHPGPAARGRRCRRRRSRSA